MTSCFNFWQKSDDIQPVLRKVLLAHWMVLQTDFHLAFFHQPTSLGRFANSNSIPWSVTTTLYLVLKLAKLLTCLPFIVERLFHRCHFGLGSMKCWNAVIPWFEITCSFRLSILLFLNLPVQMSSYHRISIPIQIHRIDTQEDVITTRGFGAETFEVISARLSSELPRWTPASEVLFPRCTSTSLCWWFRGWCGLWCRFLHAYNRRAGNYSCLLSNTYVVPLQTSKTSSPQTLLDRMATPDAVAAANILMTAAVSYTPPAARDSTGQCGTLPKARQNAHAVPLPKPNSWSWYPQRIEWAQGLAGLFLGFGALPHKGAPPPRHQAHGVPDPFGTRQDLLDVPCDLVNDFCPCTRSQLGVLSMLGVEKPHAPPPRVRPRAELADPLPAHAPSLPTRPKLAHERLQYLGHWWRSRRLRPFGCYFIIDWSRPWWWSKIKTSHIQNFVGMFFDQHPKNVEYTPNIFSLFVLVDFRSRQEILMAAFIVDVMDVLHINNVGLSEDLRNLFCKHWNIFPVYRWFENLMFANSGNDASSFLVLEEFCSVFAQDWSFCPTFLWANINFWSVHLWISNFGIWARMSPISWGWANSFLSSSFPGLTRDPDLCDETSSLYWLCITRFTSVAVSGVT